MRKPHRHAGSVGSRRLDSPPAGFVVLRRIPMGAVLIASLSACAAPEHPAEEPPSALVSKVLANPGYAWQTVRIDNLTVHAPSPAFSADSLQALAAAVEHAAAAVRRHVDEPATPPAHVFFVSTRDQLQALAGGPGGGRTEVDDGAIFYVSSPEASPPLRHELAHWHTWRLWGDPAAHWISEGVAIDAVGGCEGHDLHAWAAALGQEDRLSPFEALSRRFDFASLAQHLQAASFVRFVRDEYGLAGVRQLWRGGMQGLASWADSAPAELERRWLAVVRATAIPNATRGRTGRVFCE